VPTPAVVVDFGTATNFDVVSPENAYIGGAIAPELTLDGLRVIYQAHVEKMPVQVNGVPRDYPSKN
jgi:pantothenate kinase type III